MAWSRPWWPTPSPGMPCRCSPSRCVASTIAVGKDGRLEIREYDELGRLEGAIRAEADRVLSEAQPSPEDLEALRAAFVPTMVRINAEGGYARRRARADEMPPRAKTLLRRFIDARLLISDRDQAARRRWRSPTRRCCALGRSSRAGWPRIRTSCGCSRASTARRRSGTAAGDAQTSSSIATAA